jgi:hypothetical protein
MRSALVSMLVVAGLLLCRPVAAQQDSDLSGVWRGPWYRGMTSGVVTVEIAAGGAGTIHFTNLETFGEHPVPLEDFERKDSSIEFSASGNSRNAFMAKGTLSADGRKILGNARYEGFGVRFELRSQD